MIITLQPYIQIWQLTYCTPRPNYAQTSRMPRIKIFSAWSCIALKCNGNIRVYVWRIFASFTYLLFIGKDLNLIKIPFWLECASVQNPLSLLLHQSQLKVTRRRMEYIFSITCENTTWSRSMKNKRLSFPSSFCLINLLFTYLYYLHTIIVWGFVKVTNFNYGTVYAPETAVWIDGLSIELSSGIFVAVLTSAREGKLEY